VPLSYATFEPCTFVEDKISGLDSFYWGFSNCNYAKTSDEYTGTNGQLGPTITNGGHFIDTTTASGGNNTSPILAEVCKVIPSPVANGTVGPFRSPVDRLHRHCS
jgi:hypothetical protein